MNDPLEVAIALALHSYMIFFAHMGVSFVVCYFLHSFLAAAAAFRLGEKCRASGSQTTFFGTS